MKKAPWILCILPLFAACIYEDHIPIEMVSMNQSQPLGTEKSLEATVRFDVGSLEISQESDAASLYSLDLYYDKASYMPDIQYDSAFAGEEGRFSFGLESTHKVGIRKERHNNRLRLAFTESIPLKLQVTAGVGESRLSLSKIKLAQMDFQSGMGEAKIKAYEPNPIQCEYIRLKNGVGSIEAVGLGNLNFREFEFEGGIGGADLEFTGDWKQNANIRITVGIGGVNIRMPREIGARVEAEKHFLSGVHLEGFSKRDSVYYSNNYDSAAIRISIRVTTGIGEFRITWI
jgi:hypothetical protein